MNNNDIYHHGIMGQKWGVRRYQHEDGTYTDAGLKRKDSGEHSSRVNSAINKAKSAKNNITKMKNKSTYTIKRIKTVANDPIGTAKKHAKSAYDEKVDSVKNKFQLSDKQKKALKVGAVVAGSALAVYGGYKLSKYVNNKSGGKLYEAGKNKVKDILEMKREVGKVISSERKKVKDARNYANDLAYMKKKINISKVVDDIENGNPRAYEEAIEKAVNKAETMKKLRAKTGGYVSNRQMRAVRKIVAKK